MLEKMKYHLSAGVGSRQIRIRFIAVMMAVTIAVVTLLTCSVKTVKIIDGEKTYTVRTLNGNTGYALSAVNLKSDSYDILSTAIKNRLTTVRIAYTFPVYVTAGNDTRTVKTSGGTVTEILSRAGYVLDEYDLVQPSAETVISGTEYIDYTNIDYVSGTYTEAIPSGLETVYSDKIAKGTDTVTNGTDGVMSVSYIAKVVNGETTEKTVTGSEVVTPAVSGVRTIGTAVPKPAAVTTSASISCVSTLSPAAPIELDANGIPVNYKSKMTSRATAYTYTGHNTATGVAPQPGYIAVNPNVIPYGTKMYIRTGDGRVIYGYAVAADTGGFVKSHPTGVDLFFSTKSACISFGVRNVDIYILN